MAHHHTPTVMLFCVLLGSATASAQEPTREELLAELRALQARVATLEAQQRRQDSASSPPDTSEVDRTKENVLRDADERSRPLSNVLAGHDDDGFFLRSPSGDFTLRPVFQFQFRSVASHRRDGGTGDSDTESGFEVRRMEFSVIMVFVVQNTGSPTGLRALFGWFVAVVAILHVLGLWIPSLGAFLAEARKKYYGG